MATTFVDYTGDGNATKQFTFPSYKVEDIKVEVDNVIKTVSTHYNITSYTTTGGGNVVFTSGNIPTSPASIRIFRDTDVDTAKATYAAGSSVKADDLNNNQTQLLYSAQEEQNQTVITSRIKDSAVTTAKIKADNITGALIADDQINSEHYVDGSIDTAHIADAQITTAKIADNAITPVKIQAGAVETSKIANGNITETKIGNDAVNSQHYVDGSIDTQHIADAQITTAKIAADAVTNAKIADDSIDSEHYVDGSIDNQHIADQAVTGVKIAGTTITNSNLASNSVTTAKIQDSHVTTAKIADDAITTAKIADANITAAKIASNAVTTDKIQDGELTTLAGMQSTTASNLASSTALTATTAELNQLDGITLETSVTTNSDTRIPTSKAVNDLVLSVVNAVGGFVAIANETSFPTTNPDPSNNAGTVVSISQLASGLAVNSSGVATIANGAGTGNTVTITGFPSSLVSQTLPATSGLQVQTTSTLHTYTFHKQLASAADIQAISATVNSFSNRYRVSASAPTSSLDGGDLWYDTTNSKLMVYSSQNSAWEESSAIGNFFISTISSSSSTGGGSATANGTAYRFTISDAPVSAQQLLVSVDGVIQKPNAGSSQPSEGFVLVGNDIIFGAAPANGASLFVTVIGSTVGIGTPSNNTVTSAILQNGSVINSKIADDAVNGNKIADSSVTSAHIVDGTIVNADVNASAAIAGTKISPDFGSQNVVTTGKLGIGTTSLNSVFPLTIQAQYPGIQFLDAQGTDAFGFNADGNTFRIQKGVGGSGPTVMLEMATASSTFSNNLNANAGLDVTGNITVTGTVDGVDIAALNTTVGNITTDVVSDTSPQLGGDLDTNSFEISLDDLHAVKFGDSADLSIFHQSGFNQIQSNNTSPIQLRDSSNVMLRADPGGAVDLRHNGGVKFQTLSNGASVTGRLGIGTTSPTDNLHVVGTSLFAGNTYVTGNLYCLADNKKIFAGGSNDIRMYHDGSNSYFDSVTGHLYVYSHASNKALIFGTQGNNRWQIYSDGHFVPDANNTYDIGTTSARVRNIYTNDLHLSNEGHSNDVDGSWGNWTIQEGESDLFLKNNRSGKKYKFNLTEVS